MVLCEHSYPSPFDCTGSRRTGAQRQRLDKQEHPPSGDGRQETSSLVSSCVVVVVGGAGSRRIVRLQSLRRYEFRSSRGVFGDDDVVQMSRRIALLWVALVWFTVGYTQYCNQYGTRKDCGYVGITQQECQSKGNLPDPLQNNIRGS
jgi:hypothetical protein